MMKKMCSFICIPLILFLFAQESLSQVRETQPVAFKKLSDRLYEVTGGSGARGGVYIGDNEVLVIDAKMDKASVDQVLAEIRRITDKPITYLVNTHSDGDHISGNRYFPRSVQIIAHENCRKEFFLPGRDGGPSEWSKPELAPFIPSLTFREKMDVYLGSKKLELWYFGTGHTTGDIVVYISDEKTAFIGDQYFYGRPQLIHSYKGGTSFGHVKNLTKMLETLDAEKFLNGHSEMTDRAGIKKHIDEIVKQQEKIRDLIDRGKTLDEIKREFEENEAGLVETIYAEIKSASQK